MDLPVIIQTICGVLDPLCRLVHLPTNNVCVLASQIFFSQGRKMREVTILLSFYDVARRKDISDVQRTGGHQDARGICWKVH